ncbi:MAG: hypothetical protein RJA81_837, partial [Planctomycetota bacterium]
MNHMNRTYGKTIPLLCSISLVILLGLSGISEAQSPSATTAGQDTNSLLVKAPFDRIILSDKTDLLIEPVSPRPLPPAQKKPAPRQPNRNRSREAEARAKEMENDPAIRILVQPLEAEGMEYAVYREDITEILYFDDMLLAEADRLTNQGEFAKAFEHLLYVNSRNPEWSGLSDSYRKLLLAESKERFEAGELASGLQFVMEALTSDSRDEQARSLAIDGLAKLAEEELSRNQLERARESHARMKKLNPNAEEVKRLEDKLKSISEKLFADAPSDRPERLDQLNEAYRAWPDTTGLSEARVAAMNRWPTVRVAVSETAINPPRPWAVGPTGKRLANLLFLPLLQDLQESSFKGESPLQILEKFEMTDLTTASLTVRSGQKWSNGREINARDVVAAMSAWAQPTSSAFHGVWSSLVDSVSVPSPNKVQIRFTRPIFQPEAWLLRPIGPAENSQAEELPESAWLGSGLMLWQGSKPESSGDQAVFIRRPDLDKGLYRLQEIVISDEDEAWQA